MIDPRVLDVQKWVNNTYRGKAGFIPVLEDGNTGWQTVNALTRALQVELGITPLSDAFGPTTLARVQALGDIRTGSAVSANIVRIIQSGLYCKGYDGGTLDGAYGEVVTSSVQTLRSDMGLSAGNGAVTAKIFKALLTMDAYVLVDGGNSIVRQAQQSLNARYVGRRDFFIVPADGYFSRSVQNALLFALQYEIGMADGTANGNFGPGTQQGLRSQALLREGDSNGSKYFVSLFQAALNFNGYPTALTGTFTSQTRAQVTAFQQFARLFPVSGVADFTTWASLLVSTGDTARAGQAVDCITTITNARAQTLVAHGYETVGRYLTNTPGGSLDKNLKPGELETIFANNLSVFPIYQEGGTGTSFFNYNSGFAAGKRAHQAANSYGFKRDTTIYFAVDFDALGDEVAAFIVPHFRGINDAIRGSGAKYRVGIYGARNVCSTVSRLGLASLSFVSGMSTGFSGNLGYPLPSNWAFDQILEYTIGSGAGAIGIDKNIKSYRDDGQRSIDTPPTSPEPTIGSDVYSMLYWLQGRAAAFVEQGGNPANVPLLVAQWIRRWSPEYQGTFWDGLAGPASQDWSNFITSETSKAGYTPPGEYYDKQLGRNIDLPHLFAVVNINLNRPALFPRKTTSVSINDFGGWAGDLVTMSAEWLEPGKRLAGESPYSFGKRLIGGLSGRFSAADLAQDADGYNISDAILNLREPIARAASTSLLDESSPVRFQKFLQNRFGSASAARAAAQALLTGDFASDPLVGAARAGLWFQYGAAAGNFAAADLNEFARAFGDVLAEKAAS